MRRDRARYGVDGGYGGIPIFFLAGAGLLAGDRWAKRRDKRLLGSLAKIGAVATLGVAASYFYSTGPASCRYGKNCSTNSTCAAMSTCSTSAVAGVPCSSRRPAGCLRAAPPELTNRAVERGEVDPARLTPRIIDLPFDLFRNEWMMTLKPVPDHVLRQIVDDIFIPLVTS
jgi:hypothetical protein